MRHRKAGRRLGRNSAHRKAMYRNMVTSLMVHGQIQTTEAKAKELRRIADKVITMGKRVPSTMKAVREPSRLPSPTRSLHPTCGRWVNNPEALERPWANTLSATSLSRRLHPHSQGRVPFWRPSAHGSHRAGRRLRSQRGQGEGAQAGGRTRSPRG